MLKSPGNFEYIDLQGKMKELGLPSHSLAFTYCQVPVIYRLSEERKILLVEEGERVFSVKGYSLDREKSTSLFRREGGISRIEVYLDAKTLLS